MWRRSTVSAVLGLGLLALAAAGQQPLATDKKPAEKGADKKAADPVEALIESALANDPDVRMARAKIQLADAELAKARQQVAVKVVTLHASIQEQRRVVTAAEDVLKMKTEVFKRGGGAIEDMLPVREKVETAKAQLARLETELRLITGTGPVGLGDRWDNLNAVHQGGTWNASCLACHSAPNLPRAAAGADPRVQAGLNWLADHQSPRGLASVSEEGVSPLTRLVAATRAEVVKGPAADRIRAALDRPVRLGPKGEKVSFEKAMDAFKAQAGLDVVVRRQDLAVLDSEGKPVPLAPIVSEGEELQVGAWLQLIEDSTGYRFYIREYGLLFALKSRAPTDAMPLVEFWKQKPVAKVEEKK